MINEEARVASSKPNVLLKAAMPLLAVMITIQKTLSQPSLEILKDKLMAQIKQYEVQLQKNHYSERVILAARYGLCTALDEMILKTSWGFERFWLQQGLLNTFYQEADGGEKFYVILDNLLINPREHLDILELFYFILSLGFKGKWYQDQTKLNSIRQHLFKVLIGFKSERKFFLEKSKMTQPKHFYTFSLLAMIVLTGCVLLFTSLNLKKYSKQNAKSIYQLLTKIDEKSGK